MTVTPVGRARLAAAIVVKNDIISVGHNRLKSHPFQARFGSNSDAIYLHAEIDAILSALRIINPEELSKAELYVARVKYADHHRNGFTLGLSKPCIGCQRAIQEFGIKRVIYSLDENGFSIL